LWLQQFSHAKSLRTPVLQHRRRQTKYVLIAHTTFGKGVSFMENKIKWHYWPMSPEEYKLALQDVSE
jgi:transketolase